jgi:hypothetical protein
MTKRILTISAIYDRQEFPFIRLRGKWLQKLGFQIGQKITVEESEGQLIIKVLKEG